MEGEGAAVAWGRNADERADPPTAPEPAGEAHESPDDAAGFAGAAADVKAQARDRRAAGARRGRKPKRGRAPRRAAEASPAGAAAHEPAGEPLDHEPPPRDAGAARERILASRVPSLVARIYARGIDVVSLLLLSGMAVPASYYTRQDLDADAQLWAESLIDYSFDLWPEQAESAWRFVAVAGLPLLHVSEGVMAARDAYAESVTRDVGHARVG
jgi:hypothetical protein